MIRLSSFFVVVVGSIVAIVGLMVGGRVAHNHSDQGRFEQRLARLQAQATHGLDDRVARAIDQTMACLSDKVQRQNHRSDWVDHGDTWDQQRLVMWDPCTQQGAERLHLDGLDDALPLFNARLAPLTAEVARASADGLL